MSLLAVASKEVLITCLPKTLNKEIDALPCGKPVTL